MPYADVDKRRLWQRTRYFQRRRCAIVFLGGKCAECGMLADDFSTCSLLEIDHVDPTTKPRFRSSHRGIGIFRDYRKERFWEELEKCQLLCVACHQEKTIEEQSRPYFDDVVPF